MATSVLRLFHGFHFAFALSGMEKINFSGGEPFLHEKGDFLGKMVQFCKQDLQLPSVSIVSNGSMIKERWFQKYGKSRKKNDPS